ncbi:GNAT family N-acetyltransferase (plasmid) [Streptomyces sp. NBC_00841]|uniref:GNAT family N-acetyltransferase n=1 Tax=unclassified Streptomyces TaxID=2593676 RepID=UPI00224FB332|nr:MULTISPECIES: GNAT family N-acetyltransferase [unclassified Streptomyces]MCX4538359.1 GNAT family N-acetyltransferase [Streptomyces sp. NBC_01669]WSA05822.1 GNAT family N-acetyltransferase [Streptomyces sp. NBC_00841]
MPSLVTPVMSPGSINSSSQPSLPIDDDLLLRPWLSSDAGAVARVFQDRAIQFWHLRKADSEDEAQEWIEQWRSGWESESACHWAVVDIDGDRVLGRVSLQSIILVGGQAEISYWTTPESRGKGVCSRAVARVASWALEEAGFNRLELGHSTANVASCRIAEKTGFALEGVRRQALLHADGWHDMHLHARVHEA